MTLTTPSAPRRDRYRYEVLTTASISRPDLDHLIEASLRHYDSTCRALSIPGPDAALHGWRNMFWVPDGEPVPERASWTLSVHHLDVLCKVLEQSDRWDLRNKFRDLLREAIGERERVNAAPPDPEPTEVPPPCEGHLERELQAVDAEVFSSDALYDEKKRDRLRYFLGRWQREAAKPIYREADEESQLRS